MISCKTWFCSFAPSFQECLDNRKKHLHRNFLGWWAPSFHLIFVSFNVISVTQIGSSWNHLLRWNSNLEPSKLFFIMVPIPSGRKSDILIFASCIFVDKVFSKYLSIKSVPSSRCFQWNLIWHFLPWWSQPPSSMNNLSSELLFFL